MPVDFLSSCYDINFIKGVRVRVQATRCVFPRIDGDMSVADISGRGTAHEAPQDRKVNQVS